MELPPLLGLRRMSPLPGAAPAEIPDDWGRAMGHMLGGADLITPDGKWMYPQGWEHYIEAHSVKPWDEDFIADAVAWRSSRR